jgi:hypothetical protein
MMILVGCEESGTVRDAFQAMGHDAWSCDLLPTRKTGKHLKCDVMDAIADNDWDIIILHPPCDYLAVCGNRWYGKGMAGNKKRNDAIVWTAGLWQMAKKYARVGACLENPVGVLSKYEGMYRGGETTLQYIQPWQFGHGETKKTGLFLHKLKPLEPTSIVSGREQRVWKMPPGENRKRDRSQTYQGIAIAMSEQWG